VCGPCKNKERREQYASDEAYRAKIIAINRARYNPQAKKDLYHERRRAAFQVLGGYVCSCGYDDPRALQIDHVDNQGYARRKKGEAGEALYRKVIETKGEGFQVLCANCNWIKKAELAGLTSEYYHTVQKPSKKEPAVLPSHTYLDFDSDEAMSNIAKRLHISFLTLRRWWVDKFGEEAVRLRGQVVQRKAVRQTGLNNKGHGRKDTSA
jgi:hypothetical protein